MLYIVVIKYTVFNLIRKCCIMSSQKKWKTIIVEVETLEKYINICKKDIQVDISVTKCLESVYKKYVEPHLGK